LCVQLRQHRHNDFSSARHCSSFCLNGPGQDAENDLYSISISNFSKKYFRFRAGFRGGLINAPFKYRPDKDKIYPGGNLSYYGAWLINTNGLGLKPLLFAGLTTITTTDANNTGDSITKLGYTMGFGLGIAVFTSIDLGVIAGWDIVDKDWESNGKVWLAVSFNFGLNSKLGPCFFRKS